jgi:hypothetical protein
VRVTGEAVQIGPDGVGVAVGVFVAVGVAVGVRVGVAVAVAVGIPVCVGVTVGAPGTYTTAAAVFDVMVCVPSDALAVAELAIFPAVTSPAVLTYDPTQVVEAPETSGLMAVEQSTDVTRLSVML